MALWVLKLALSTFIHLVTRKLMFESISKLGVCDPITLGTCDLVTPGCYYVAIQSKCNNVLEYFFIFILD